MAAMNSARFALPSVEHYVKSVHIWSFSGLYFPAFGRHARKYGPEKLQIRSLFTYWNTTVFVNLDIPSSVT